MKKILALLLALTLALSLSAMAFAEDVNSKAGTEATITVEQGRKYEVYQIFTGDLAGTVTDGKLSDEVLSNVVWGQNGKGYIADATTPVDEDTLKTLTDVASATSDTAKLEKIEVLVNFETTAAYSIDASTAKATINVPVGYYLLKDVTTLAEGQEYSLNVVEVVGPTTISPKAGETTTEKKIDDKNDSTAIEDEIVWQDSADYDIGDSVPFQLKATITEKYDNYKEYLFIFHDQQSEGLTFKPETVHVYVDGNEIDSGFAVDKLPFDGCTFDIVFENLKDITSVKAGSVITVTYESELNAKAVSKKEGNPNTMHGEYSNNPNSKGTGETPDDTVVVFTYDLEANKIDGTTKASLEGAGFTLYKFEADTSATGTYKNINGIWNVVGKEVKGEKMTEFKWKGIDDGYYKLVESTTPAGYNTMEDLYFEVFAEHNNEVDVPEVTKLETKKLDKNGTEVKTSDATDATVVEPFAGTISTGILNGNVENNKGAVLPETGGIGTTIFYIVGSVLVVAAAIVLFAKKRVQD